MPKPPKKAAARPRSKPDTVHGAPRPAPKRRNSTGAKRSRAKPSRTTPAEVVTAALDDLKALETTVLDVRHLTTVTDAMVVTSGRSDRHVRAIAGAVVEQCKKAGYRPLGVEGEKSGEWVLVDLGELVVHVMLPRVRDFYKLEQLWGMTMRDEAAELGA